MSAEPQRPRRSRVAEVRSPQQHRARRTEVMPLDGLVGVRDSKDRQGPALALSAAALSAFVAGAARGDVNA